MSIFDTILNQIDDADRAVIAKYPQLQQTVEKLDGDLSRWEQWRQKAWDSARNKTHNEAALEDGLAAAQSRIAELQANGDAEMTFEDILKGLGERGYATKSDVAAVVAALPAVADLPKRIEESSNQLSAGFEHLYTKTIDLPLKHQREFGEDLDMDAYWKHMRETQGYRDPRAAYDSFVAAKRGENQKKLETEREAKHTADLEAARKDEREKANREAAMSGRLPTDSGGPAAPKGTLDRRRIQRTAAGAEGAPPPAIPDDVALGDGTLAQLGYEQLLKDRSSQAA